MWNNLYGKNLVMSKEGLKFVSDIETGDLLLNVNNGFSKVLAVKESSFPLLSIKGHGHPDFIVYPESLALSTNYKRIVNKKTGKTERKFTNPAWVLAQNLKGSFWSSPIIFYKEKIPVELNENISWLIGAYLANGYTKSNKIYFLTSHFREEKLSEKTNFLKLKLYKEKKGSIFEYYINHAVLSDWIRRTFDKGYGIKNIPLWVYGMDKKLRENLFDGFVWGSGVFENQSYRFSIRNNKYLAIGMKLIAQSLGYSTALYFSESGRKKEIKRWQIVAEINARSSVVIDNNRYGLIREIRKSEKNNINYSIKLDKENGIIVDGIIIR